MSDTWAIIAARLRTEKRSFDTPWLPWALPISLAVFASAVTFVRARHVEAHFLGAEAIGYSREFNNLARHAPPIQRVVLLEEPHADENTDLHYFPVEEYWAKTVARQQHVEVGFASDLSEVPDNSWIISCSPRLYSALAEENRVDHIEDSAGHCVLELTKASQAAH